MLGKSVHKFQEIFVTECCKMLFLGKVQYNTNFTLDPEDIATLQQNQITPERCIEQVQHCVKYKQMFDVLKNVKNYSTFP